MNALKIILLVVLVLVALVFITALFVKKEIQLERNVIIERTREEVYNYLKYLKNQDNFSVWAKIDPNMKKEYKGEDGTVGFVSAWDSEVKSAGKGEQEITRIVPDERIDYELRFKEPFESKDKAYILLSDEGYHTRVTWGFDGRMKYPMNLMLLFYDMEDMIGKDYENGLQNLKEILEKREG